MRTSRSSAVLARDLIDRWLGNDRDAIGRAFGTRLRRVELEAKFPTGLRGTPPAPGLSLTGKRGRARASRFAEPLASHPAGSRFKGAHFEGKLRIGQSRRQQPAKRVQRAETGFCQTLQFLKRALGRKRNRLLRRLIRPRFDNGERESRNPARKTDESAAPADDALGFQGVSRREIFGRLADEEGAKRDCADSMQARYLPKRGP